MSSESGAGGSSGQRKAQNLDQGRATADTAVGSSRVEGIGSLDSDGSQSGVRVTGLAQVSLDWPCAPGMQFSRAEVPAGAPHPVQRLDSLEIRQNAQSFGIPLHLSTSPPGTGLATPVSVPLPVRTISGAVCAPPPQVFPGSPKKAATAPTHALASGQFSASDSGDAPYPVVRSISTFSWSSSVEGSPHASPVGSPAGSTSMKRNLATSAAVSQPSGVTSNQPTTWRFTSV